jgi:hydroxyacylglutathione hydrolase
MVERVVVGQWKTNCYIYSSTKKECIIIDPGGSEEEIASRVDVLNMVPVGIALTHGHVDHLAALGKLRDSYAARGYKLPIAINPADRRFLGTGGRETHRENLEFLGLDELSFFGVDADELPKADVRLKEGDKVFNMDLTVLETPGHTPGSVCFYAEKEGILFSGDTLFFDGVGRSDLPGGSEKKLRESIQKKIASLPPETRVFPGHGPFTTVEREKRGNSFFRGMEAAPSVLPRPVHIIPRPVGPAKPAVVQKPVAAERISPAAVKRPLASLKRLVASVKRPLASASRSAAAAAKRPADGSKSSRGTVKRSAPGARRTSASTRARTEPQGSPRRTSGSAGKAQKKQAAPKRSRPASARPKTPPANGAGRLLPSSKAKQGSILKKGRAAKQPRKKSAQATRSTKAPGAGRKPAR